MPDPPIILSAIDDVEEKLNLMAVENGYHRDYGPVQRVIWSWDQEPDRKRPCPLIEVSTLPGPIPEGFNVRYDQFQYIEEIRIYVHIDPEHRDDGTWDLLTPWAEIRADIHAALISSSSARLRGIARYTTTHYLGTAPRFFGEAKEAIGGTVLERYGVSWAHAMGDMATLPGV